MAPNFRTESKKNKKEKNSQTTKQSKKSYQSPPPQGGVWFAESNNTFSRTSTFNSVSHALHRCRQNFGTYPPKNHTFSTILSMAPRATEGKVQTTTPFKLLPTFILEIYIILYILYYFGNIIWFGNFQARRKTI